MKTISVKIFVYVLTDALQDVTTAVCLSPADTIVLGGMGIPFWKNSCETEYFQFEDAAYHLYEWATKRGMTADCYEKTIEINIEKKA